MDLNKVLGSIIGGASLYTILMMFQSNIKYIHKLKDNTLDMRVISVAYLHEYCLTWAPSGCWENEWKKKIQISSLNHHMGLDNKNLHSTKGDTTIGLGWVDFFIFRKRIQQKT